MPALVNFPLSRPILSSDSVSWEADQPPVTADTGTMLFVCLEILIVSGSHAESWDAETLRSVRMERNYVGTKGGINSELGGCSDNSLSPHLLVTKSMVHPLKSPSPPRQDVWKIKADQPRHSGRDGRLLKQ